MKISLANSASRDSHKLWIKFPRARHLGVEEQYYIIYPLLLLLIGKHHKKWLLPILTMLGMTSLVLFFLPFKDHVRFYYIPFRFFELALGGMAALHLKDKLVIHRFAPLFVGALILIMCMGPTYLPNQVALPLSVMLTLGIIVTANNNSRIASFVLQNKLSVALGLISFSLYMWHQIILSYVRYFLVQKLQPVHLVFVFLVVVCLSVFSYYVIEQPFRNKKKVRTGVLLSVVGLLFVATTLPSLYVYRRGGIIRDVPELGITRADAAIRGIHKKYNSRVYDFDRPFTASPDTIKILVIGDSFARDWANVLLESSHKSMIEISYVFHPFEHADLRSRAEAADIIFDSEAMKEDVEKLNLDSSKLYVVGTKNFGISSGYFYNYAGSDYFAQRTPMEDGFLEKHAKEREEWAERYIDLIAKVIDENHTVPVFTADHMFISQDCRHLTKAGAVYFAQLFEQDLATLLDKVHKVKPEISQY